MAKLTKKGELIQKLHSLVEKEAALAQTNISGKPGADTNYTSVSESTETTDKNNVGPEHLNSEQKYEQKPASDPSEPVAAPKQASAVEIDKLATDILSQIESKLKDKEAEAPVVDTKEAADKEAALAQTGISGKPGKDTKFTSVSDSTEHTDKNKVGPEHLNSEQEHEQKPSSDKSEPVAHAKKAEDATVDQAKLNKEASYKLGSAFAEALIKKAAQEKHAAEMVKQAEMLKEAGRRDFEALIQEYSQKIKTAQEQELAQQKQAEAFGEAQFEAMMKQAQLESLQEENAALKAKLAEYVAFEKEAQARYEAQRREEEQVKLANAVIERLKHELSFTK